MFRLFATPPRDSSLDDHTSLDQPAEGGQIVTDMCLAGEGVV